MKVEFRVGEDAPARPVAEKAWLKTTGPLPRAINGGGSDDPSYDIRLPEDGGCDPPIHFDGCHVFYIKVRYYSSLLIPPDRFFGVSHHFFCGFYRYIVLGWWW